MHSRTFIALAAPFLLTGCLAQSQIQGKYMDSQEECRNETARSVAGGETARPVSENQASPIAQRFSDCMTKEGWHLSTPKPAAPTTAAATPPANGSSYPKTVSGPPASAYPQASSYPVYAPYQQQAPAASTAVTASTPVTAAPPVATYQPVRAAAPATPAAASDAAPYYGTGPGRQF